MPIFSKTKAPAARWMALAIFAILLIAVCRGAAQRPTAPTGTQSGTSQKAKGGNLRTPPSPRSRPSPSKLEPAAPPAPFHAGEKLEYRVLYSKYSVNAANVEIATMEQRNFFGHSAWHLRAMAHTIDTTRLLFPLDDQFDSYASAAALASLQYEMYLHEQGKQQTSVYRLTTDAEPAPPEDVTALRVSPGTRDPISFLYALRAADWQHTPELRGAVFDGHILYDAVARVDMPDGSVNVPAGMLNASRIALQLFNHAKEVTDTHLWVWIGHDPAHTPLLIEGEIPFGTFRIELMKLP